MSALAFFERFARPKHSSDFLCGQLYGLNPTRFGCVGVQGRPPLDLPTSYQNAIAYNEDVYSVFSQQNDAEIGIPGLSMAFANHPNFPHFLVVGDEEGVMYCRNTKMNATKPDVVASTSAGSRTTFFTGHSINFLVVYKVSQNAIFAFKFIPEDPQAMILAATGDRSLIMLDPQEGQEVGVFEGHTASVKCLDFQKDAGNNVFASGARDGHILVWDIRVGCRKVQQAVSFLANAHSSMSAAPGLRPQSAKKTPKVRRNLTAQLSALHEQGCKSKKRTSVTPSITDLVFQDRNTIISTGTVDGSIKFWDIRNFSDKNPAAFYTFTMDTTFTSLCLDRSRTQLFASARDKNVYRFDAGIRKLPTPTAHYAGANINSFYIKCTLSVDDEVLGCGSGDSKAYLFKVREPESAPLVLVGHKSEVMGVAFNHYDPHQLATNGDDNQVMIWRTEPWLKRSDKNVLAGECEVDSQVIDRTQKPRKPAASKRSKSKEVLSLSPWMKKGRAVPTTRSLTPPPRPQFAPPVLRTPNRTFATQSKKKKFKNTTLSPFLKLKPSAKTQ